MHKAGVACYHSTMLFLQMAWTDPLFYFAWVLTVVVSIILHELAHGWVALWQGDDTPRRERRMTLDPMVHLGPFSLVMLFVIGIAWGQMPVNPYRFRSRHGDAMVSAAGPAMNLLLAFVSLTTLAVLLMMNLLPDTVMGHNLETVIRVFGIANIALALFNLLPVPPLDGASVLASFNEGYRQMVNDPARQGMFSVIFLLVFIFLGGVLFTAAIRMGHGYVNWLTSLM